jgi:hypothetical protein
VTVFFIEAGNVAFLFYFQKSTDLLIIIRQLNAEFDLPWIMIGDFNKNMYAHVRRKAGIYGL